MQDITGEFHDGNKAIAIQISGEGVTASDPYPGSFMTLKHGDATITMPLNAAHMLSRCIHHGLQSWALTRAMDKFPEVVKSSIEPCAPPAVPIQMSPDELAGVDAFNAYKDELIFSLERTV